MTLLNSFSDVELKEPLKGSGAIGACVFTDSTKRKESRPPVYAGLDAAARGFAEFITRDADALLVWYRTGGRERRREAQLYIARRAIAARWDCTAEQAFIVIEDALTHVASSRHAPSHRAACMRKKHYFRLRALASAWLRAGILDALYRYHSAIESPEPAKP